MPTGEIPSSDRGCHWCARDRGNQIEALRNGDEIFPAMLKEIERARCTIDFLTFVYWVGTIGRAFAARLSDRARAGIRVRVLLDGWGAKPIE